MKLLSVAIPCYNSAAYMEKCIKSLLPGGKYVEIIIVDDGSFKDDTARIADEYAAKYPDIIKAVHQENGGHGEAVNTGLAHATGKYFKVVDSDDHVSRKSYKKVLETLREITDAGEYIDMLVCNYVYDKEGASHKKVMRFDNAFPEGKIFTWEDMGKLHTGQYILMHSVIYRTKMLKECEMVLPKHTFYVDNYFVYHPLPYVKKLYYLNENFYKYYIGREDQSVNEKIMISRLDQQIRVNKLMIDDCDLEELKDKKVARYMYSYLLIMTIISSIMAIRSHDPEKLQMKEDLWKYLKETRPAMYRKLRMTPLGIAAHLPGEAGRTMCERVYGLAQKIYGFN